jgi:hypothetical protein
MIPAHLLDLVQPISFHPTVNIELDGGAEEVSTSFLASNQRRIEALFSDAHRSRRTRPVTKATSQERIQLGRFRLRNDQQKR